MLSKPELGLLHAIIESEMRKRQDGFRSDLSRLSAELASRGISGGPAIGAFERLCLAEADLRCDHIVRLVKANVMGTTYDIGEGDLLAVFDTLSPIDVDLIEPIFNACRIAGLGNQSNDRAAGMRFAVESKVKKARIEIEFFAGAPRRENSSSVQVHGDVGHLQMDGRSNVTQFMREIDVEPEQRSQQW